jgi:rubrerythrin
MKFENSQTLINLCSSYAGETQDGAKYQFMAKMALNQDLTALNRLLKNLAQNEMAHAEQFFNKIKDKTNPVFVSNVRIDATYNYSGGDLQQMLDETVKIEQHQEKVVYKNFERVANEEGFPDIAQLYKMIADIEGDHAKFVNQLAEQLRENIMYQTTTKKPWKCSECGYEETDTSAPTICPVCQMPQGTYYLKTDLARYFQRQAQ